MVRIRLLRRGRKKKPLFKIVVCDIRTKRDGAPIEEIGSYNPISKDLKLDKSKAEQWIKFGALPTQTVANLLKKNSSN